MWVESSLFAFLAKTLIYPLDHRLLSSFEKSWCYTYKCEGISVDLLSCETRPPGNLREIA